MLSPLRRISHLGVGVRPCLSCLYREATSVWFGVLFVPGPPITGRTVVVCDAPTVSRSADRDGKEEKAERHRQGKARKKDEKQRRTLQNIDGRKEGRTRISPEVTARSLVRSFAVPGCLLSQCVGGAFFGMELAWAVEGLMQKV